jgi:hypothetical protein
VGADCGDGVQIGLCGRKPFGRDRIRVHEGVIEIGDLLFVASSRPPLAAMLWIIALTSLLTCSARIEPEPQVARSAGICVFLNQDPLQ